MKTFSKPNKSAGKAHKTKDMNEKPFQLQPVGALSILTASSKN